MTKDPRIDAYIETVKPFAKPILERWRRLVHHAIPDVTESIKWGMPHFEYHGVVCHMAAFKQHCSFGFWNASSMNDPHLILKQNTAMGHLGKVTCQEDLPSDAILMDYVRHSGELNKAGVRRNVKRNASEKPPVVSPLYLIEALDTNPVAKKTFESFSDSHKREYVEWLEEAKRPETRERRLMTTLEWLAEGKARNWKYEKK